MIYNILSFLLNFATSLLAGVCLLRMYMQWQRVSLAPLAGNPFAPLIFSLTDWCVLPLRKVLPVVGRIDLASLIPAYLIVLAKFAILSLLWVMPPHWSFILGYALLELARLAISGVFWLTIIYVLLSWIRTQPDMQYFIARLVEPLLKPFQNVLPRPSGMDFSPIALLLVLQILGMILSGF
jgi:YggT family protein